MKAKYVHTNLIAKDWRALAQFYIDVFGCEVVPPERDYTGDALDAGVGFKSAHLVGAHLRLPGWGENAPTLEIYNYNVLLDANTKAINRVGFGHIAFEVDDVSRARENVLSNGGSAIGEVVTLTTKTGARVTWCYVADPEGNAIELQAWSS